MNKHLFLYPELLSRLVFSRTAEGKYLVQATSNQQPRSANPEEIIRQIFVLSLIHHYHYPEERIKLEQPVLMGRDRKRADVVVTGDGDGMELVVEVKQDIDGDAIDQLRSYLMATGASTGAVVSGHELRCFTRVGNQLVEIDDLPMCGDQPADTVNALARSSASTSSTGSTAPLVLIERFERVNLNNTQITIKGRTHLFSNEDLADLKKVRQRFINDGIGLGANIWKPDWLAIIESQFANAAPPPPPVLPDLSNSDGFRCLRHLCEQVILDRGADGSEMHASIYDLIQQAQSPEWGTSDNAKKLLRRHGIIVDSGAIFIANDHTQLRALYKTSAWPIGWADILKSVKGVTTGGQHNFGGRISRASRVPLTILQRCLEATARETPTQTAIQPDS